MGVGANGSWLQGFTVSWGLGAGSGQGLGLEVGNCNTANVPILPHILANKHPFPYIKRILESQDNLL